MVKITDDYLNNKAAFAKANIKVPTYDAKKVADKTLQSPTWVHFGGGNLFRAFHASIANQLIESGKSDTGVIVAETYDDGVVSGIYGKYNNRIVRVVTKADGSQDRELFAPVAKAIYAGPANEDASGFEELEKIFENDSLQVVSFSITEKGYHLKNGDGDFFPPVANDIKNGPSKPQNNMSLLVSLMLARFNAGKKPLTLMSTDNFSQNGDRLKDSVLTIAKAWKNNGFVNQDFIDYLSDPKQVGFPLSMIDRITPNPSDKISADLAKDGFEDAEILHTPKHTNIAAFTNTEEAHYLVVEDDFPNGRPAFEEAGVIMTDRDTVNAADEMKVTTCLNPLHTALAIYGSILGFDSIASEMQNDDLVALIKQIGYIEGLPVVKDPKVINPKSFIDELVTKRLPNPYIPDTPQRIATDTSQKLSVRYGVTIQHYVDDDNRDPKNLNFIPLVIATWLRYLMGVNDKGEAFTPSPDPMYDELHAKVDGLKLGGDNDVHASVKDILSNKNIFSVDLYQVGLGEKVEAYFTEELKGAGQIEKVLHDTLASKATPVK
ncbi:mannitol dehydrogenase family protein [Secundilactobacillus folii]|uniref:Mannitol dehydrogenase family protein n=1 Tax=Secundilactobacillus folii TaxID=2678357 RepID=A0A7X2XXE5_9LACO|nr:mannitol dehydrogenase family protein [Secundilactobacillus folii]MTV83300.1 mannitol dehydrogenase family protein [Secundilactobacillus folii]